MMSNFGVVLCEVSLFTSIYGSSIASKHPECESIMIVAMLLSNCLFCTSFEAHAKDYNTLPANISV